MLCKSDKPVIIIPNIFKMKASHSEKPTMPSTNDEYALLKITPSWHMPSWHTPSWHTPSWHTPSWHMPSWHTPSGTRHRGTRHHSTRHRGTCHRHCGTHHHGTPHHGSPSITCHRGTRHRGTTSWHTYMAHLVKLCLQISELYPLSAGCMSPGSRRLCVPLAACSPENLRRPIPA